MPRVRASLAVQTLTFLRAHVVFLSLNRNIEFIYSKLFQKSDRLIRRDHNVVVSFDLIILHN